MNNENKQHSQHSIKPGALAVSALIARHLSTLSIAFGFLQNRAYNFLHCMNAEVTPGPQFFKASILQILLLLGSSLHTLAVNKG